MSTSAAREPGWPGQAPELRAGREASVLTPPGVRSYDVPSAVTPQEILRVRRLVDAAPVVPVDKVGTAPAILFEQSRRRRAQVLSAAESRGSSKPQTSKLLRRSATRDLRGRRRTSRPAARFACSGGSAERMALSGRVRATNRRAWRKRCRPDQGQLLLRRRRGPRRRAASRRRPRCARPRSGPCLLRALQSPYVHGLGWLEPKRAGAEQEERGRAEMPSRGASRSAEFDPRPDEAGSPRAAP